MTHIKKILILTALFTPVFLLFTTSTYASSLVDLVFAGSKSTLPAADKDVITKSLGLKIAADGKSLIQDEFPTSITTRELDLNADHVPELLVIFSGPQFGMAGSSVALFIKDAQGKFTTNLGFPAADIETLPTKTAGYQDLKILGPGFECPIWKWSGKEYIFSRTIKCE